jgi:hypothetical protein
VRTHRNLSVVLAIGLCGASLALPTGVYAPDRLLHGRGLWPEVASDHYLDLGAIVVVESVTAGYRLVPYSWQREPEANALLPMISLDEGRYTDVGALTWRQLRSSGD